MKKTIIAAAAIVAMVGCNKSLIETAVPESGYGYINLGVSADTEMVVTKALADVSSEELAGYNVVITKQGAGEATYSGKYSGFTGDKTKVEAGTYTVYVENNDVAGIYSADDSKGSVRVSDTETIIVKPGLESPCNIECLPQNSMISFIYTQEFVNVFGINPVTVTNTASGAYRARTVSMTMDNATATETNAAYFEPSISHTWTFVPSSDSYKTKTYTGTITPVKAKWTQVTFAVGDAQGTIKVTVKADKEIVSVQTITATLDPASNNTTQTTPTDKN